MGNDWLTKTKGLIDYNHQTLNLNHQGKNIRYKITCWKKPKFDDNGRPIGIEPMDKEKGKETFSQDEIEFEETPAEDQAYCVLIGNSNEEPLVELEKSTITIGQREESIVLLTRSTYLAQ